jgi:CBS domain-containing protein
MRAVDVMTSEVITVDENASVPAVAKLLAERGISAVLVVDKDHAVIGIVSEGDLLHRAETGTERRRSWWLEMMSSTNQLAGEYIKAHSGKLTDVMTRNVISVTDTTPVADIAVLLETNRDQAGAGPAERQAGGERQPREPRASTRHDARRAGRRRRSR